jgi:glycosyltransferase involved in cell wall biosynthesis
VLPNTVDGRFQAAPKSNVLLDKYGLRDKQVLLTVSRLSGSERYKGHDRIIRILPRVLAKHPGTKYLIVGDGDDRARLEVLATEVGVRDRVHFAGLIDPADLPGIIAADVFAPSTRRASA